MAILFDLDGTLLDTSQDIHAAVNKLLAEDNKSSLSYETVRDVISMGSEKILSQALDNPKDLVPRLIEICLEDNFKFAKPFPGIMNLLDNIEKLGLPWGIVTNRTEVLTTPLLNATGYLGKASCVVCGDTTKALKPKPDSLLHACQLLSANPSNCVYIGDSFTDIQAGKAAGMPTIGVSFGFINSKIPIETWQADHVVEHADQILPWIKKWSEEKN